MEIYVCLHRLHRHIAVDHHELKKTDHALKIDDEFLDIMRTPYMPHMPSAKFDLHQAPRLYMVVTGHLSSSLAHALEVNLPLTHPDGRLGTM